jgi:mono/diheme cytochrome c family protein
VRKISNRWIGLLIAALVISLAIGLVYAYSSRGLAIPRPTEVGSLPTTVSPKMPVDAIGGIVSDAEGRPVAGATIRIKTTEMSCITDATGHFTLLDLTPGKPVTLTAWAAGYYNGGGKEAYLPGQATVALTLTAHTATDHPEYRWLSAFTEAGHAGSGEGGSCQNCHADTKGEDTALPFPEWQGDAHALATQNPRFLSMYLGTDLRGDESSQTTYGHTDYASFPQPPDLSQPYCGPGQTLDVPDTAGNCAACHAPAAAIDWANGIDPSAVSRFGNEGVACDFCHKVWDVKLEPSTGLPYAGKPGVLSFEFRRPPEGHQFFAGPYDDVAPGEDTYTPIQQQSQFCAPCHYGVFWNTVVYNSYGEWLKSPYSDPARAKEAGLASAKSCQDCHMPAGQTDHFATLASGGQTRDPATIFSHRMPGASDESLLRNTVTLTASAGRDGAALIVAVTIVNDQAGHHVPTDSPLRQMILLVNAVDAQGQSLAFQDGPTIPAWGGQGDPQEGYYAGLPGKGYAKILAESFTGISPSGRYWNWISIVSDNRIPALGADASSYSFGAPAGAATVEVTLLFRRAFKDLMDQKGWDVPDIEMESLKIQVP